MMIQYYSVELIIAKHRNGPIGTVELKFDSTNKIFKCSQTNNINAQNQIRTGDTRIFNPLLYQLSYPGLLNKYSQFI